jgi:ATP-dependent RNA helicase DeaD
LLPDTISAPLAKALAERGYTDLTPVQSAVVAPDAFERDLLVSARTGSGKTVAFGLGIATTLLGDAFRFDTAGAPLALVIAPTRELAMQVERELAWLYAPAGGRIVANVGGMDPRRERQALDRGCHIVVGTPGRLRDHVERKALDLSSLRAVVLDEADEMLDMGFKEDLTFLLGAAPVQRRTLMFSATLPKAIVGLAQDFQTNAFRIASTTGETAHADISYVAMHVSPRDTEKTVVNILREKDAEAALIFCRTRESVKRLHALLSERGFTAVCLSGELSQGERNHALQALRDGRAKVCVATDVAARGIDLPHLSLVIHADLPLNAEVMQHRSGRTGRAGRKGTSILMVAPAQRRKAERLLADAKIKPTWGRPPDAETIRALDRARFLKDPMLSEETTEDDRAMGAALLKDRPAEEIAAILAKMYRSRLPEPEELDAPHAEVFDDRPGRKRSERFERNERPEPAKRFERREKPVRNAREPNDDLPRSFVRENATSSAAPQGRADNVVFRLDVGRKEGADPKWLLPMLCRRGGVTRKEIGAIRIFEATTEFEVSGHIARDFERSAAQRDGDDVSITRADAAPAEKVAWNPRAEKNESSFPAQRPGREQRQPHAAKPAYGTKPAYEPRLAYEDRPPRDSLPPRDSASSKDGRPPATPPNKAKSRFDPKTYEGGFKGRFNKGGDPKGHAKSGFQHRKGTKGK